MQYQAFYVENNWDTLYHPLVVERASAIELATVLQTHTIQPAVVTVNNPFINRPNDPFFEPKMLRDLGWDDDKIYRNIAERAKIVSQVMNTNFWHDVMGHVEGRAYLPSDLFAENREQFMELPVSTDLFFSVPENINACQQLGFDGVIYKGMAATRDSTMIRCFRSDQTTYGEFEHLPL